MSHIQEELSIIKFTVHGITSDEQYSILEQVLQKGDGVTQVDINKTKGLVRIIIRQPYEESVVKDQVIVLGFSLSDFSIKNIGDEPRVIDLRIHGMTCRSCEVLIERKWKKMDGIHNVSVDAAAGTARIMYRGQQPDHTLLQSAIAEHGYQILKQGGGKIKQQLLQKQKTQRPSIFRIIGRAHTTSSTKSIFNGLSEPLTGIT